ncbi:hypothetical protein [Bacillus cereus group sp. BcHK114]|uniref:hypothetical protein n=1 Tax=Bacillus cereus group sp. BcHK114 TaxID=3018095 RepID=UPI0022DEF769|nr:hypothetical protein [Bacillus cereus group sp. BcHK114]MDA1958182.1 hypothetical protein [Bacillus cereus group sp. BcHK114]
MPIFYHITENKNATKILQIGLKPMPVSSRHPDTQKINKSLEFHLKNDRDDILSARENGVYLYAENNPNFPAIKRQFSSSSIFVVMFEEIEDYAEKFAANHQPLDELLNIDSNDQECIGDLVRSYAHSWVPFDNYGGEDGYEVIYEGSIPPEALKLV